jgi:hypothetical protein
MFNVTRILTLWIRRIALLAKNEAVEQEMKLMKLNK